MMFQRFLDDADYWFGYSDDSSVGSYDPARECFVDDQANGANAGGGGGRAWRRRAPPNLGTGPLQGSRPSAPPPHRRGVPTSTHSWPKHASSRPSLWRSTARCNCFVPPLLEKLRVRRTRVRAGQAGARPHQRRLQHQQPEHAPTSEPKAHRSCNTAASHARSLDARGAKPAPRGAGAH
jgi:hypothetical protein